MKATHRVRCIVSGGQTGVDRAALDWAIDHGLAHTGWCPRGRRAEDGPIPRRYRLRETPAAGYASRTRANVRDSDATLLIAQRRPLRGGTALTARHARALGRPCLLVWEEDGLDRAVQALDAWLQRYPVRRLNVAGPRASGAPGIGRFVRRLFDAVLD